MIVDTDSDGLPDWWEDQFGLDKTNATDAALDPDGDGTSNGNELLARTDPGNPASNFRITQIAVAGPNIEVTFPTVLGRNYSLEDSTTLGIWQPLPGSYAGTGNPLTLSIGPVPAAAISSAPASARKPPTNPPTPARRRRREDGP